MNDGRTLTFGAIAALLLGGAALSGSRSSHRSPIWIHYDAVGKKEIQDAKSIVDKYIQLGHSRAEAERNVADRVAKKGWFYRRTMRAVDDFLASGQQVFVVGPKLEQMFVHTSLDKVPRDVLRAPFPCFWIALPDSELRLWSPTNGWVNVRGMYVDMSNMENDNESVPPGIHLLVYGPYPNSKEYRWGSGGGMNAGSVSFDLDKAYGPNSNLESYTINKLGSQADEIPAPFRVEVTNTYIQLARIAINLLLYVNASGAELIPDPDYLVELALYRTLQAEKRKVQKSGERDRTKRREIERIDEKTAKLSGATVVWLGKSIEEAAPSEGSEETKKRRRHWVRGHWRIPPRKSGERLLVWVQPFERNVEEEARVTRRTYRTKGDENE